jgi:hypothetical protein
MAVNDLPSNVSYGTVVGRFLLAYADGVDSDQYPDGVPAKGTILFTPAPANIKDATAVVGTIPTPVTILPATIQCSLDSDGYLLGSDGTRGVRLVATDDPDLNPADWTWQVDYRLTDQDDVAVRGIPTHDIEVPGGQITDLTLVAPVAGSDGVWYIRGPQGYQGLRGRFFSSPTPPTYGTGEEEPLTTGDAWFDETSGRLYVYYDNFWIESTVNLAGPVGPKGPKGDPGQDGADGQGVNLSIGTVASLPWGETPTVTISGTFPNQVISFEFNEGPQGPQGIDGEPAMHPFMLAFS